MEELKQKLVDFFIEMQDYRQYFKRKIYKDAFMRCYEEHKELLASVITICEQAEDKDEAVMELARAIPEYAHGQVDNAPKKSKKEALMMDYNMTMVTFVVPVLTYNGSEYLDRIADRMIELWNKGPITMKLGRAGFEELNGSFKSHPCYITTAVCESQNKADNCYELMLLREYRDGYLLKSPEGESVVRRYYDVAPTIVNHINKKVNSKEIYQEIFDDYLSSCISLIEENKMAECQEVYTNMVMDLQKKYLYS